MRVVSLYSDRQDALTDMQVGFLCPVIDLSSKVVRFRPYFDGVVNIACLDGPTLRSDSFRIVA